MAKRRTNQKPVNVTPEEEKDLQEAGLETEEVSEKKFNWKKFWGNVGKVAGGVALGVLGTLGVGALMDSGSSDDSDLDYGGYAGPVDTPSEEVSDTSD